MQYLPTWSDPLFVSDAAAPAAPLERAATRPAEAVLTGAAVVKPTELIYRREVYSISGHRVTNDDASGWKCECRVFGPDLQCDHVRQALRLRTVRQTGEPTT
jgi:hypothetical protein